MATTAVRRSSWLRLTTHFAKLLALFVMSSPAFAQLIEDDDGPPPVRDLAGVKMTPVGGRVVDEMGKPVGNAQVAIATSEFARSARPKGVSFSRLEGGETLPRSFDVIGPVATNAQGEFLLPVPESRTGVYSALQIYATAQGHGCAIRGLGQTPSRQPLELALSPEHVIRGRVIDLNGQPASGVKVFPVFSGSSGYLSARRPLRQLLDIWKPVTTDDKGRFLIRGICPDVESQPNGPICRLHLEGDNYTPAGPILTRIKPVPINSDEVGTISLAPARRIRGRVTFSDTGKPAAKARIVCSTHPGGLGEWIETRTDANGEYSITPYAPEKIYSVTAQGIQESLSPNRCKINVFPPAGETYLVYESVVRDFSETNKTLDLKLERGVLIKGRVTDSVSEAAIAGARVQYIGTGDQFETLYGISEPTGLQTAISKSDGTYELAVPRGVGHLVVLGPTLDYVRVESSQQEIREDGKRGKGRWQADAIARVDFKTAATEQRIDFELRKGMRLKGRVVDPDNHPVEEFVVLSGSYLPCGYQFASGSNANSWRECRAGEFEMPGCDPKGVHIVYLYDPQHGLGATATLTHQNELEPANVQLKPCGSAVARFVDGGGKLVPQVPVMFGCKLSDGVPHRPYNGGYGLRYEYPLEADVIGLGVLHSSKNDARVDAQGMVTFSSLIPGARYMASWTPRGDFQEFLDSYLPHPSLDFTVKAGERKNLGDVVIEGQSNHFEVEEGGTLLLQEGDR